MIRFGQNQNLASQKHSITAIMDFSSRGQGGPWRCLNDMSCVAVTSSTVQPLGCYIHSS